MRPKNLGLWIGILDSWNPEILELESCVLDPGSVLVCCSGEHGPRSQGRRATENLFFFRERESQQRSDIPTIVRLLQVELLGWGEIAGNRVTPLKETIMDGELPVHCPEPEIAICGTPHLLLCISGAKNKRAFYYVLLYLNICPRMF